jgi:hypothetical protein
LRAFGVPEAEIAKMPATQAMQFTNVMSKYALNLVNTYMDDMLGARLHNQLGQAFPGFSEMYEKSANAMSWDSLRNSDPRYASLPAFGTKEFKQTLFDAYDKFPEVVEPFVGKDGKISAQMAPKAYAVLARIATGQGVNPEMLKKAAAAGARNARRGELTRSAGNLGSGQSKAGSGSNASRFQTNSDLFDDDTMSNYQREHGRL